MHKVGFIGLGNMGKGMAQNLSKNNILVNAIAPGFIETRFHTKVMKRKKKDLKKRLKFIKLLRAGKTSDITNLISFLLFLFLPAHLQYRRLSLNFYHL